MKRTISTLCLLVSFSAGCTPVDAPEPEMPRTRLIGWDVGSLRAAKKMRYRIHYNIDSSVSSVLYYQADSTLPNGEWRFDYNDEKLVSKMSYYWQDTLGTWSVYQYNNHKLVRRQNYGKVDTAFRMKISDTLLYGTDGRLKAIYERPIYGRTVMYKKFEWDMGNLIGYKRYFMSSMADSLPKLLTSYTYKYNQQPNLVAALLGSNTHVIMRPNKYYLLSSNILAEESEDYGSGAARVSRYTTYNMDSTGRLKESYEISLWDDRVPDTLKSVYIYE